MITAAPEASANSPWCARRRIVGGERIRILRTLALAAVVAATGCGRDPPRPGRIDPAELGRLVAAVVPGPDTYFIDAEGKPAGFEHDLLRRLANSLNVSLDLR